MESNSMVTETVAGCENMKFTKTARATALGIIDAKTTHLQPPTLADKVHCMLGWILVYTLTVSEVPQTLQGGSSD